jgi:hypothetical protein
VLVLPEGSRADALHVAPGAVRALTEPYAVRVIVTLRTPELGAAVAGGAVDGGREAVAADGLVVLSAVVWAESARVSAEGVAPESPPHDATANAESMKNPVSRPRIAIPPHPDRLKPSSRRLDGQWVISYQ